MVPVAVGRFGSTLYQMRVAPASDGLREGLIELSDGRRLAYAERGDPLGVPIVHHHGMPGSRLDHVADPAFYTGMGVRVITPDRPGYGRSDPNPRGTLTDWARDVSELADALDLGRFGMTALSGGGIHALACAAAMPERLCGVVVTGCPAPMNRPGAARGMRLMSRVGLVLGRDAPWALATTTAMLAGTIRRFPGLFVQGALRDKPAPDRRWLSMRWVKIEAESSLAEAFRHGSAGYARDVRLLSRPWGFGPGDVRAPIQLWHGDLDTVIPLDHALYLASTLRRATLRICHGEGHMVMWNHLAEVLMAATGPSLSWLVEAAG